MKVLLFGFLWALNLSIFGMHFELVKPSKLAKNPSLIVAIHGCKQDSKLFSKITQLSKLSEQENVFILYPNQSRFRNYDACWNWFLEPLRSIEMNLIMAKVREVQAKYSIEKSRSFILGLSSGAAMANLVGHCFSHHFQAAAFHSGLKFAAADGAFEAQEILTRSEGSFKSSEKSALEAIQCSYRNEGSFRFLPSFLIVGSQDQRLLPIHTKEIREQLLSGFDLLDDGLANRSENFLVREFRGTLSSEYPYNIERVFSSDEKELLNLVLVEGLGHSWSGGVKGYQNSDPKGPRATAMMWDFFKKMMKGGERAR